jgi:hypothetical protein
LTAPNDPDFDLTGLIDMHIHSAPDVQPRFGDDIEIACQADQAGMRAILLKSHVTLTADRAGIAEKAVGQLRVFGGLALNETLGGLNPAAVETAVKMGAKEIWMPTRSAAHVVGETGGNKGISLLTSSGDLLPEVYSILELIGQADIILGTGHISPSESAALARAARTMGVRKILVTHPEAAFIRMPVALQVALAREGVFFERCFVDTTPLMDSAVSLSEIAEAIRTVGVASTILSTDFGQAANPSPVDGMRAYLSALASAGFTPMEISRMAGQNPAMLLGL